MTEYQIINISRFYQPLGDRVEPCRCFGQVRRQLLELVQAVGHAAQIVALQAVGNLLEGALYLVARVGERGAVLAEGGRAVIDGGGAAVSWVMALESCSMPLVMVLISPMSMIAVHAVGHGGYGEAAHGEVMHLGGEADVALAAGQDHEGYLLVAARVGDGAVCAR